MDELIRLSKKAANEWRNTDAYYQAAVLIDSLCARLEKIENRNPHTNADRIRAMTDEELAQYFGRLGFCNGIIPMGYCGKQKVCSQECVVKWLQQPCGGADHE